MSDALFSPHWYRVADLTPRIRSHAKFRRHHYRGQLWYVLDDQGALRKHVNVFVDNRMISDRVALSDAVAEDSEVFVMQALSGG